MKALVIYEIDGDMQVKLLDSPGPGIGQDSMAPHVWGLEGKEIEIHVVVYQCSVEGDIVNFQPNRHIVYLDEQTVEF